MKSKQITTCAIFTALLIICTFLRIDTPIIPITFQTFSVILVGLLLNKKLSTLTLLAYITLGLIGFPVFASGGGISYILKPTFGYILGFLLCVFIINLLPKQKHPILSSFCGLFSIYILGFLYFYIISNFVISTPISAKLLFLTAILAPLPSDIFALFVAIFIYTKLPNTSKF